MRDRLMKLLCSVECDGGETLGNCPQRRDGQCGTVQKLEMCQIGAIADHLLANGVIVPPCKVGDNLYVISQMKDKRILPFSNTYKVTSVSIRKNGFVVYHEMDGYIKIFKQSDFGKTVFLTKAEAEKFMIDTKDGVK